MKLTAAAINAIASAFRGQRVAAKQDCPRCHNQRIISNCNLGFDCGCPDGVACSNATSIKCECVK